MDTTVRVSPKQLADPGFGEIPFLKSGIVSALDDRDPEAGILYLDGQNNPGFSGGPIVFWHSASRGFRVAGVVRGYRNERGFLRAGQLSAPPFSCFWTKSM